MLHVRPNMAELHGTGSLLYVPQRRNLKTCISRDVEKLVIAQIVQKSHDFYLTFYTPIKSHLPFAGIISSPYSTR